MSSASVPDYSIVVPVYFNEGSLEYTANRIFGEVFAKYPERVGEIVFVDDGSGDGSFEKLMSIHREHPECVRVIRLSRNFGQVNAWWCGLEHTPGPVVVVSADGQDPIDLIPTMLKRHFEGGVEVVIATRESREESAWRRMTSSLVYNCIRKFGNADMPSGGFDFFLLGDRAKRVLLSRWQPNTFFQVRVLDLGFRREMIPYCREGRKAGVSRWTFAKKFTYMLDGVLGHSYFPIRFMTVLGLLFSAFSFFLALFFFVAYFFNENVVRGWTPIILLILFVGGVQMMMTGIIGEYLWRVLAQARNAPPYIVDEICDRKGQVPGVNGDTHGCGER